MKKIAIITDIHGNYYGLEACIKDIFDEGIDEIYCLGDLFTGLPNTKNIFEIIQREKIQCIRGNNEGYLLKFYDKSLVDDMKTAVKFKSLQFIAKQLSPEIFRYIVSLPKTLEVKSFSQKIILCHGT
ncbi:hypothetical protein GF357_02885, partial [Candidatus Dojkabacteria bacterium]|nr:hypothetical protein [Candidatus Dojkabacteria bacterium]